MQKDRSEFIRLKAWLFRHEAPLWEEGVAECIFFSLMAWVAWRGA